MKHLNEPPKPPSALAPGIPVDLDRIVVRALAKDPAGGTRARRSSTPTWRASRRGYRSRARPTERQPQVLAGLPASAPTQVLLTPEPPSPGDASRPRRPPYDPYADRRSGSGRSFPWLLVILLLAGRGRRRLVRLPAGPGPARRESKPVPVPLVIGIKQQLAIELIENDGSEAPRVSRRSDDEIAAGIVIEQDPEAGTRIAEGRDGQDRRLDGDREGRGAQGPGLPGRAGDPDRSTMPGL